MNTGTIESPFGTVTFTVQSATCIFVRFPDNGTAAVNGVPFRGNLMLELKPGNGWSYSFNASYLRRVTSVGKNYNTDLPTSGRRKIIDWAEKSLPSVCTYDAVRSATIQSTESEINRKEAEIKELEQKLAKARAELTTAKNKLASL